MFTRQFWKLTEGDPCPGLPARTGRAADRTPLRCPAPGHGLRASHNEKSSRTVTTTRYWKPVQTAAARSSCCYTVWPGVLRRGPVGVPESGHWA
jgi:hypothetical protein